MGAVLRLHPSIIAACRGSKCTPESSNTNVRRSREFPGTPTSFQQINVVLFQWEKSIEFCSSTSPSHAVWGTQQSWWGTPGCSAPPGFPSPPQPVGALPRVPDGTVGPLWLLSLGLSLPAEKGESTSMRTREHLLLMPTGQGRGGGQHQAGSVPKHQVPPGTAAAMGPSPENSGHKTALPTE